MRRLQPIPCGTGWIMASLDGPATARRGWVFVTGGTQIRAGPHRLYARLAAELGAQGEAVIRFDRRGVGDSPGDDPGFAESAPEIAAAGAALRGFAPGLEEVRGFGLCDGATALALHGRAAGIGPLLLANPWAVPPRDDLPPAAAIRGHYARRLADPAAWARLVGGGVDLRRLARGLVRGAARETSPLAARIAAGLTAGSRLVLAEDDGTAQAFASAWAALRPAPPAVPLLRIATASHSFADAAGYAALSALIRQR
ncbi:hydrolase 1, exosortase A system-associated [Sphingomonas morindae]|uniref:Hydrolase 1, exosortase A system-associated n=1 Tax=Sphingomonas morindae TaxID=1541170 RepID=A0ABY4X5E4_9SPHN|nr:hydrolase 1, exosortase A system-associated [Sphingomonas morindae]USI72113.1 hydrolase 1, exosortase A system-associated [Sphingomonas morindae]